MAQPKEKKKKRRLEENGPDGSEQKVQERDVWGGALRPAHGTHDFSRFLLERLAGAMGATVLGCSEKETKRLLEASIQSWVVLEPLSPYPFQECLLRVCSVPRTMVYIRVHACVLSRFSSV